MNACTTMPAVSISLHRPLWRRVAEWASEQLSARWAPKALGAAGEPMNLHSALALNDHLLRDIGVSEVLRDQAAARRGIERMAAHVAHEDFALRGRHWYG